MTETDTEKLAQALRRAERKLSAYVGVCSGDKELTNTILPMCREALAAHDTARAQPASVPDCDHVWVEYVQPVYKNAMAGDVIRSGECGVKRYENLGFMCDKCGAVKPPAQPASVADGWVMVPREPTEEMLRAEDDAVPTDDAVRKDPYAWGRASWKAFLAATPQPPAKGDEK